MARLRVGVVGCGQIAQIMHLHNLRELSDLYELTALCDLSPGTVRAVAELHGVETFTTDFRELVAMPVDAVLVLNSGSHLPPALAALEAGRPLFVEKPAAPTASQAGQLAEAARRAGVPAMVGYMKRYDPSYLRLLEMVEPVRDRLRLAQLTTLEGPEDAFTRQYHLRRVADVPAETLAVLGAERDRALTAALGRVDDEVRRGYGLNLAEACIHDVNAMRGVLGEPICVEARRWAGGDAWAATFEYPGELRALYTWAWLDGVSEYTERHAYHCADLRLELSFPSPFLRNAPTMLESWASAGGGEAGGSPLTHTLERTSYQSGFAQELRHFHACVSEGLVPRTPISQGRDDLAWLEAMWRSSESGRPESAAAAAEESR